MMQTSPQPPIYQNPEDTFNESDEFDSSTHSMDEYDNIKREVGELKKENQILRKEKNEIIAEKNIIIQKKQEENIKLFEEKNKIISEFEKFKQSVEEQKEKSKMLRDEIIKFVDNTQFWDKWFVFVMILIVIVFLLQPEDWLNSVNNMESLNDKKYIHVLRTVGIVIIGFCIQRL